MFSMFPYGNLLSNVLAKRSKNDWKVGIRLSFAFGSMNTTKVSSLKPPLTRKDLE